MNSIDIETIFTILFVAIDDWYQKKSGRWLAGKAGRKARFSDSEVMTLMLAAEYLPFPSETQYLAYIRANHRDLFPQLLSQSQFNRRARGLRHLVEQMRRDWLLDTGLGQATVYLLDTKPLPVLGYKRSKKRSDFLGSADYGYCASRHLRYFGYKMVMISTVDGIPVCYELAAANTDERQAAETVLDYINNAPVIADKGFLGIEWQAQIREQTGNRILTPRRKNQKVQHKPGYEAMLNSLRERIEGVFHELQNTGRNLERLMAKTVDGLATRLIAKVTAHLFKHILRLRYKVEVQTFQCSEHFHFT
jgi:hypothetical protein